LAFVLIPAPELLTQRGQRLAGPNGAAYGAIYAAYNAAYALGILLGPLATGSAVSLRGVGGSFLLLALAPALSVLALLLWRAESRPSSPESGDGMATQRSDGNTDGNTGGDAKDLESD
jgi:predicted MFS family arabinose efflux permease